MKLSRVLTVTFLALFVTVYLTTCVPQLLAQDQPQQQGPRTLKVKVKYAGSGTVDESHKLFVFVFDTPDIQSGPMPIGMASVAKNEDVMTMENLSASPVYVVAVYDSTGTYQEPISGPPPSGSPVTMYSKDQPGVASPIEIAPGQTTEIEVPLDDSFKMP